MRFFAAVLATLAVGAIAADAVADEDYSTVMVTETTTYCPKATSAPVPELSSSAVRLSVLQNKNAVIANMCRFPPSPSPTA
jgi:hypothetical protein